MPQWQDRPRCKQHILQTVIDIFNVYFRDEHNNAVRFGWLVFRRIIFFSLFLSFRVYLSNSYNFHTQLLLRDYYRPLKQIVFYMKNFNAI